MYGVKFIFVSMNVFVQNACNNDFVIVCFNFISTNGLLFYFRKACNYSQCGHTDKGVSAYAQVRGAIFLKATCTNIIKKE